MVTTSSCTNKENVDLPVAGNPVGSLKYSKSFSAGLSSSIFSNIWYTSFFDESLQFKKKIQKSSATLYCVLHYKNVKLSLTALWSQQSVAFQLFVLCVHVHDLLSRCLLP